MNYQVKILLQEDSDDYVIRISKLTTIINNHSTQPTDIIEIQRFIIPATSMPSDVRKTELLMQKVFTEFETNIKKAYDEL